VKVRWIAGAALLGLLAVAGGSRAEGLIGKDKFKPGDRAPEFEKAFFLDGREARLGAVAGQKVVLLNFWGLRCGSCLEEMPYLEALAQKYRDTVVVWGVDTDGADAASIRDTLASLKVSVSYPLITDPEFMVTDTYTNFLVPLTIVIDRDGIIRYIHTGYEQGREKEYEAAVRKAGGA